MNPNVIAILVGVAFILAATWAERLHQRRCSAIARLAFGPTAQSRRWTRIVPLLTVVASGMLGWGLTVLALSEPQLLENSSAEATDSQKAEDIQRILILLDVSPSMNITDAGERKDKRRRDRIMEVTEGICSRIALGRTRFSVMAFFTSARPVVVDTSDVGVIRNVLDNLPLVWSFEPGETKLLEAIKAAGDLAHDWPPKSTTLMICTDGDTADFSRIPQLPRSIHKVDILAVGDSAVGTLMNNHDSRQQAGILRRLAAELGGSYYDVNTRHVPSSALTELSYVPPQPAKLRLTLKDIAILCLAIGAILLTIIPVSLEYFGSSWNAAKELPKSIDESISMADLATSRQGQLQKRECRMKKWFVLIWLLIPIGLLSYHYGPGQQALAWRDAQSHFNAARQLEKDGHWEKAIDEYQQAMSTLPVEPNQKAKNALARDQLRFAQTRARFQLGHLSETIEELRMLADEVQQRHGADSLLVYDIRDLLGRVHFQAMIVLRLESAEAEVWKRQWELSRQNFRYLAERTPEFRNQSDRKNLEAVIKSADLPVQAFASASASASSSANGFTPPTGLVPPTKAAQAAPATTVDVRQKKKQPAFTQIDPPEFILGN